jgi:Putative auto-transporter adhesin, head GIN domain
MQNKNLNLLLVFAAAVAVLTGSCRREDPYEGFVSKTYNYAAIDTLQLDGVYDVILIQDTLNKIVVNGPERVVNKTGLTTENGTIRIDTRGNGQMFHPREANTRLYVHVTAIKLINVFETCSISTPQPLTGYEIGLVNKARTMDADLKLNCTVFYYWNNPVGGQLTLHGQVNELKFWNAGLARVDASDLQAEFAIADNGSQNNCILNARQQITYSLTSVGNILYYGNPQLLPDKVTGTGQILRAN